MNPILLILLETLGLYDQKNNVKIASINMEYGGCNMSLQNVFREYYKLILENDLDIICFQETHYCSKDIDVSKLLAKKLGYHHSSNKKAYISTISKYPMRSFHTNKNYLTSLININDKQIFVTNIHLNDKPFTLFSLNNIPYNETPRNISPQEAVKLSYESKKDDIEEILEFYENINYPSILCGDFNEISHLDSNLDWIVSKKITKTFTDVTKKFYQTKYTWFGEMPLRIDMIYSKNIEIQKLDILQNKLSDHTPIISTFLL